MTIWPLDSGEFGLDATWQGTSGYELAERHALVLTQHGLAHSLRQELGGGWSLRLGPMPRALVLAAVAHFTSAG